MIRSSGIARPYMRASPKDASQRNSHCSIRKARVKQMVRLIGDRELAWILLAIAGLIIWSMLGLESYLLD